MNNKSASISVYGLFCDILGACNRLYISKILKNIVTCSRLINEPKLKVAQKIDYGLILPIPNHVYKSLCMTHSRIICQLCSYHVSFHFCIFTHSNFFSFIPFFLFFFRWYNQLYSQLYLHLEMKWSIVIAHAQDNNVRQ